MQQTLWNVVSREPDLFHDKAYRRSQLPPWDDRWHTLSVEARREFLEKIPQEGVAGMPPPAVRAALFDPAALSELETAGFVHLEPSGQGPRVQQNPEAGDFGVRVRALARFHLLAENRASQLSRYINFAFAHYPLQQVLGDILQANKIGSFIPVHEVIDQFVVGQRWPQWVAQYSRLPLAEKILDLLEREPSVLLADLPAHFPDHASEGVRLVLEVLIVHLAVFEDLDPDTWAIRVGLLPSVKAARQRYLHPSPRPDWVPCTPATEPTPEEGIIVPDLRAILLELAAGPVRLKQDRTLYQKDAERMQQSLGPLPDWLVARVNWSISNRADWAFHYAFRLKLIETRARESREDLALAEAGNRWLQSPPEDQFSLLFEAIRESEPHSSTGWADTDFLGSMVVATVLDRSQQLPLLYQDGVLARSKRQPLRDTLYRILLDIPQDYFVLRDTVLERTVFGKHNPLLLGRTLDQVEVRMAGRLIPPLEERLEEVGRQLLSAFLDTRLFLLGCLQLAVDADGRWLVRRTPRFPVYFGRPATQPEPSVLESRVVVQPDFSIIVIGLNPAPAADLIPFCERLLGTVGSGSLTLRISRDTVLRAIQAGLPAEEILPRLHKHSSSPLPANVLQEVKDWCEGVRTVTASPATLIRCPDRATADRVQSALGRKAERLNDTIVAFPAEDLPRTEQQKLLGQGILIQQPTEKPAPTKKSRKR